MLVGCPCCNISAQRSESVLISIFQLDNSLFLPAQEQQFSQGLCILVNFYRIVSHRSVRTQQSRTFSLHKDISYSLDMLVTIVWRPSSLVSARVGIIRISSSTKPISRVTGIAVVLFILMIPILALERPLH